MDRSTAYRILIEKLHLKAVCSRWIPHRLTDNHKIQRVEEAQNLIVNLSGSTIVVDEKWLFADPLPARPHCSSWIGPDADHPPAPRKIISDIKFHIIVACDFRGNFLFKVFDRCETINAEKYKAFLADLSFLYTHT